jgi:hypothetical protein
VLFATLLLVCRPSTGAEPRIALLPVHGEQVEASTLSILEQVMTEQLGEQGWVVVGPQQTAPLAAEACGDAACTGAEQHRAVGVAAGAVLVVSTRIQAADDGLGIAMSAVYTVSGEMQTREASSSLPGLLSETVELLGSLVGDAGAVQEPPPGGPPPAEPPPAPGADAAAGEGGGGDGPAPAAAPQLEPPPCAVWNESWEHYRQGRSLIVPGIMLSAAGFASVFFTTMFWVVPEEPTGMEPSSGIFLLSMGGAAMVSGATLIGVGVKKRTRGLETWYHHTEARLVPPPARCAPANAGEVMTVSKGRLQSARTLVKGLIVPASVLIGVGAVFGTVDIALALDEHMDWSDESVRVLFAMSTLLGGAGLALLAGALGVRAKTRRLYYGEVSALPRFSVGLVPGGGGLVSATFSF